MTRLLRFSGLCALASVVALAGGCSRGSDPPVRPDNSPPASEAAVQPEPEPAEASAGEPEPASPQPASPENREPPPPAKAEQLELTFVGDVIFGRYRSDGYDPIPEDGFEVFEPMADALRSDVLVGNLETPVVRELPQDSPIGSRFRFGASLDHIRMLKKAGFTAMSLANNHWFDMRVEGVQQTPLLLEEVGVAPIGAAVTQDPVFRVQTVTAKGWRIGFVSITTRTNAPIREKLPRIPYLRTREIGEQVAPVVREAAPEHDLMVVLVHWGDEYADGPSRPQIGAAHDLIDAGANLVIGHHPHVLQGVETYGGGLVAYSLGNFLFENTSDPPRLTGVLRVRVAGSPPCVERVVLHTAYVARRPVQHPVPATGFMERKVKERMRSVSKRFDLEWTDEGTDLVAAGTDCGT